VITHKEGTKKEGTKKEGTKKEGTKKEVTIIMKDMNQENNKGKPGLFILIAAAFICAAVVIFVKWDSVKDMDVNIEDITTNAVVTKDNVDKYNYTEKAMEYLKTVGTEFTNRNLSASQSADGENQHEAVIDWIKSELSAAGYTGECIEEDAFDYADSVNGTSGMNLIATIPGKDESKQIIACAHFDGDGAGDNGSGVALLLANACGLVNEQPQYTIKFIFLDGEELGELGSEHYVETMSSEEKKSTLYVINIDSIAFGDYCNLYGGSTETMLMSEKISNTEAYEYAMNKAKALGFKTFKTEDLDGYYAAKGKGPEIEAETVYTNPWTFNNPSPANFEYASPSTGDWSDHAPFASAGMEYIYFEATNWFASGDGSDLAYTGYFDTDNKDLGSCGMFMNTEYDTLEDMEKYFPGRAKEHFNLYSPLLSGLLLDGTIVK